MRKVAYILKEMFRMIRKHKLSFLAPLFIILALLAFLVYYMVGSDCFIYLCGGVNYECCY